MAVKRRPRAARSTPPTTTARPAQRRRTRQAIVGAAMALLARGRTPSVAEVAAAADVSRRTVYLYFPTFEQLLLDATVGALSQASVDAAMAAPDGSDVTTRVERMVRALQRVSPEVERLGRALIRLTVEAGPPAPGRQQPRRGYRRLEWIESALAPWRTHLGPARWRRLVSALAMVVGWEALVVQRDVCGLSVAEGEQLSVWAAQAFLQATLRELRASQRSVRPPRSATRGTGAENQTGRRSNV